MSKAEAHIGPMVIGRTDGLHISLRRSRHSAVEAQDDIGLKSVAIGLLAT